MTIKFRLFLISLLVLGQASLLQASEPPYPNRPIRIIVPFPASGGVDIIGRLLAQKLGPALNQTIIVENRAGAGGSIGADLVAKSAADGYTILIGASSTMAVNPNVLEKLPYDTLRDFAGISLIASAPIVLAVHPSLPVRTVRELIDYARQNPGKLNFASGGNGSGGHLSGEMLKAMAGIDIVHVPYKGSAPAATDLIAGQVQIIFDSPLSVMPHVKTGRARALGVGSAQRSGIAPDVPTIAEGGIPGYQSVIWYGAFVPAATPSAIVSRLNAETVKGVLQPDAREHLARQGADVWGSSAEECNAFLKAELGRWGSIIKTAKIRFD